MKKILLIAFILFSACFFSPADIFASWDITSDDFIIEVWTFTPGGTQFLDEDATTASTVNNVLVTVLEKMIVIFGVLAAFIMTIGAGYMVFYHGQDDFLSKWKSIFISGIIALVVALSSGLLVKLFTYILY